MRKKIVAGNWKMNKNYSEGKKLIEEILSNSSIAEEQKKLIILPPFIHLSMASEVLDGSKIGLGAQNVHHESSGAYTGEVSAEMLRSIGAGYCLVGHSERRTYQKETDQELFSKVKQLLQQSIEVIFCIGETLEERESGKEKEIISQQLNVLFQLEDSEMEKLIIAYEPVWAIGTGKTASADQAQEIHAFIRSKLAERYGDTIAENTSILYGGSCKPDNAEELFGKEDVDGGLIGGASLEASSFLSIYKAL